MVTRLDENSPVLTFFLTGTALRSPYQVTFGPSMRHLPAIHGQLRVSDAVGKSKSSSDDACAFGGAIFRTGYQTERNEIHRSAFLDNEARDRTGAEEDLPSGAGALYLHDGAGYLGLAATRPEHRRKGSQSALLERRIQDALEAGCAKLFTQTGERIPLKPSKSYRNILRFGFAEAYLRPNYLSPEMTESRSTTAR